MKIHLLTSAGIVTATAAFGGAAGAFLCIIAGGGHGGLEICAHYVYAGVAGGVLLGLKLAYIAWKDAEETRPPQASDDENTR
jgi:hypothetical protein